MRHASHLCRRFENSEQTKADCATEFTKSNKQDIPGNGKKLSFPIFSFFSIILLLGHIKVT